MIAKVEPLTTARALRGPFDYRLPERMAGVGVGAVLRVPFGPRRLLGVVVELAEASDLAPDRLAEPIEALEAGASAELVRLGLWVGREYCSTPARGLSLVLPPGTGASGQRVRARFELRAEATGKGLAALADGTRLGSRQRAVLEALRAGARGAADLAAASGADRATLRRLERRGLIGTSRARIDRRRAPRGGAAAAPPSHTPAQRAAIEAITRALDATAPASERRAASDGPRSRTLLLHGVTGSGKTEVYLSAAEAADARGRGAIVLVPEIALTPQATSRFRARLGDRIAVLHSGLGAGERYDEWRRLRDGDASVCVGPRSAVFAPVRDLGLLVVDEEHDSSYKQEGDPCYDARHVARHRAAEAGAVHVAGSATPRPESWLELPRLELPDRVDGRRLPPVEVVDMRDTGGREGPLAGRTLEALEEVRGAGQKAIVLLNRRGFAPYLCCRSCGHHWGCPNCDVSLVLHRDRGALACHHCGHAEPLPRHCGECGSVTLAQAGAGTERIEGLLAERLDCPVLRLDSDSSPRGGHEEILERFDSAPSAVLVGTQMVAKGHDFPEVTLSVVLDADATLRFPDFRAEERTFALVAQVAGRSGRGAAGGRVIVQTMAPEASSIERASQHDAAGFLHGELERRRTLDYPPFSHLVGIGLAGPDESRLEQAAARFGAALEAAVPERTSVLGPAPLFRRRGRHRRRFLLKSCERDDTIAAVREVVEGSARQLRGVALSVDVDPQ